MSTKRRYLIVVNPISGTIDKTRLAQFAYKCMVELGIDAQILETAAAGDAHDFAKQAAADGLDAVLAIGGDGTVNEIASALCHTETRLGIIPCGSGNGLARHLGLPMDPVEALKVALQGHTLKCDYATANGKPFFCTFGVGFDARVSHAFAGSRRRGKVAYLRAIIREAKTYKPLTYRITTGEGQYTRKALILSVCNSSQYGNNAFIAPHASLTDGLLDVTTVNPGNPLELIRTGIEMFAGLLSPKGIYETQQTSRLTIECSTDMEAHLDGEPVFFKKRIDIECHPKGLTVFCSGEPEFKPILTPLNGTIQDIQSDIKKQLNLLGL